MTPNCRRRPIARAPRLILAVFACSAATIAPFAASRAAWPQAEGRGLIIERSSVAAEPSRLSGDENGYAKLENRVYAAYGVTEAVTVGLSTATAVDRDPRTGAARARFSDASAFVRARLWRDDYSVVSLQPLIGADRGDSDDLAAQAELRGLVGTGFPLLGGHGFAVGALAGRYHAEDGAQARLDLTVGWRPWTNVLALAQSFNRADGQGVAAGIQGSLVWDVNDSWSLEIGARREWGAPGGPGDEASVAGFLGVWRRF